MVIPADVAPLSKSTPFRAKGRTYVHALEFYEAQIRGGVRAVLGQLNASELRSLLEHPFAPDAWYDVMPIVPISLAASKAKRTTHAKLVRENAAWAATRDRQGTFRALLEQSSVAMVAQQLPKLSMQYFDFGNSDGRMIRDNTFDMSRTGIPGRSWRGSAGRSRDTYRQL